MQPRTAAIAIDGGDLPLGGGLLALIRPALATLEPGGVLAILSSCPSVRLDLPSWCRLERHEYLGQERGESDSDRHFVARGRFGHHRPIQTSPLDPSRPLRTADLVAL